MMFSTYFADGVQDEILSNLAKVSQLKVISRTSVMTYHYEHTYDRLIELEPDKPPLTLQKAYAEVTGNADLQSYLGALERTPSSMKGDIIVVSFRFAYALAARD